jgi:Tfp pilus assembly protein PilX
MNKQQGSSLVIALVFLTIITLAAVYSLEGSNIQSKMVTNSLFSTLTYQECRNEQEANINYYNTGSNRNELLLMSANGAGAFINTPIRSNAAAQSQLAVLWRYMAPQGISNNSGESIELGSSSQSSIFENDCVATFRFSTNSQTIGARVESLKLPGKVI